MDKSRMEVHASKDPNDNNLEKQDFYHGYRPRKDIEHLLKEPGDFLIRVTDSNTSSADALLVVSVMSEERKLLNLTLLFANNVWQFSLYYEAAKKKRITSKSDDKTGKVKKQAPGFKTVVELVNHYKTHKIPGKAYLKHAIPRPNWIISHDKVDYKTSDLLGSGNFCHVYRGVYQRTDKDKFDVAVKVCHEGKLANEASEESSDARKGMIMEARTMSAYTHENIIQMHGVAMGHPPILIIMEFCAGGNLESHLKKNAEKLEAGEAIVYALEACRGMRYLHLVGCVHRDLAARNVLISSTGNLKIADFGLSLMVKDLEGKEKTEEDKDEPSPQIPLRWMAPESLKKPMEFSFKSDVWSYGVLLYEIFNKGVKPWPEDPPKKIATLIRRAQMPAFPEKTPPQISEMAHKIWKLDPDSRPTMGKIGRDLLTTMKAVPPPQDLSKWMINKIPGVKRTLPGTLTMGETETEDEKKDGKKEDRSLPTIDKAEK